MYKYRRNCHFGTLFFPQALGEFFVVVVAFKLEDAGKPRIWEFSGYRKLSTVLLCIAEQLINKSENR